MTKRQILLALVFVIIGVAIWRLESPRRPSSGATDRISLGMSNEEKAKRYPHAAEIVNPSGYLNTDPITLGELIGKKVILVDFWTYSCINCQRTIPYLNAWYEKYRYQGLEIVGIHTPEFDFEKERANVQAAIAKFGITYPVVQDNDYATWDAYGNRYWPRKYLIDIDGYIVYDHIGEGGYEETEKKIQELLTERAIKLGQSIAPSQDIPQPSVDLPSGGKLSLETYFGASRNSLLGNGTKGNVGLQIFSRPEMPKLNILYLDGSWDIQDEYAQSADQETSVIYRYQAAKVFMVASSPKPVRVQVFLDGKPIGNEAGQDVVSGILTIQEARLYQIIKDPEGSGEHTLELKVAGEGVQVYTFTFG